MTETLVATPDPTPPVCWCGRMLKDNEVAFCKKCDANLYFLVTGENQSDKPTP